ncbi:MAG: ATP synthase F1 subunit delta [Deltaproteobacteria bacterium]
MIVVAIARRYAKALFSLADEQGQVEKWSSGLDALGRALASSPELRETLTSPLFDKDQRRGVVAALAQILELDETPSNFLLLLADRDRLAYLPAVIQTFRDLSDARLGRIRAKVRSAVPLSPDEAKRIAEKLAEARKVEVIVEASVDPSLLGGVVAQVGSLVYDGSVRSQLEELRRAMKH